MNLKKATALLSACLVLIAPAAYADVDQIAKLTSMVEQLTKTVGQLQSTVESQNSKIRDLEHRKPQVTVAPASSDNVPTMTDKEFEDRLALATGGANKWLKDLSFKGDMRLRYEAFKNSSGNPAEPDDRNRFRYRLRLGAEKKLPEDLTMGAFAVGFALASGAREFGADGQEAADNVSTNTTFDNNFNFKDIFIEKAYARYSPNFLANLGILKKTTIVGGKHDNAFERGSSDMIWDRDVKPEGATEIFEFNFFDSPDLGIPGFFHAGQYILDEDSTIGGDAELYGFQFGINPSFVTPFSEGAVDILSAISYYSFSDYADYGNFTISGTSIARGNPNTDGNAAQLDAKDFEVLGIYHELGFKVNGVPVRPYFDWAQNLNNSDRAGIIGTGEDVAWALGLKFGGIKQKGDWEISYAYKRIGPHSVPGGFNDSDFGRNGHSGNRGSQLKLGYGITDYLQLNFAAYLVNSTNPGAGTGTFIDNEQKRFQTDLVWKF